MQTIFMKDYGLFSPHAKFYDNALKFHVFYTLLTFGSKCNQTPGPLAFSS